MFILLNHLQTVVRNIFKGLKGKQEMFLLLSQHFLFTYFKTVFMDIIEKVSHG